MKDLTNKVAIVTGASSGIGRSIARLFASEGATVVITARRENELSQLADEINEAGGHASAFAGDVTDESFAGALVEFTLANFGRLDIAVNNAGTLGASTPAHETSLPAWNGTLETNLTSAFLGAKHQVPAMIRSGGGSLVFTSSFVGYTVVALPNMSAYAASKAGVIGLTKALAVEYAAQGVRVNALLPGGTDTPMVRESVDTPEAMAFVEGLHALKRLARPEEIADSALYLASDASSFVTGTALLVDGGLSISKA